MKNQSVSILAHMPMKKISAEKKMALVTKVKKMQPHYYPPRKRTTSKLPLKGDSLSQGLNGLANAEM